MRGRWMGKRRADLGEFMLLSELARGQAGVVDAVHGEGSVRRHLLDMGLTPNAVVTLQKAAEMGLDQLDEETQATLASEAEKNFETYIESVSSSMLESGYAEDTVRDSAISYLNENGYSQEQILKELTDSAVKDRLRESVTSEVTVTEDDVKAAYDQKVADDGSPGTRSESGYGKTGCAGG